jgi:hypothetical protein
MLAGASRALDVRATLAQCKKDRVRREVQMIGMAMGDTGGLGGCGRHDAILLQHHFASFVLLVRCL